MKAVAMKLLAVIVGFFSVVGCQRVVTPIPGIDKEVKLMAVDVTDNLYVVTSNDTVDFLHKLTSGGALLTLEFPQVTSVVTDQAGRAYAITPPTRFAEYYILVALETDHSGATALCEGQISLVTYDHLVLFTDSKNNVYLTDRDGFKIVKGVNDTVLVRNMESYVSFYAEDSMGNVYLANTDFSRNRLSLLFESEKGKGNPNVRHVNKVDEEINALKILRDDTVVVATENYFVRVTPDGHRSHVMLQSTVKLLAVDSMRNAFVTREMVEQSYSTAYKVPPDDEETKLFESNYAFVDVVVDSSDNVYFGNDGSEVFLVRPNATDPEMLTGLPNSQLLYAMAIDSQDTVFLLAEDLFYVTKGSTRAMLVPGLPFGPKKMVLASNGTLLIATEDGMFKY